MAPNAGESWTVQPPTGWEATVNSVKRRERSDLKLPDWQMYKFGTERAEEFEAASQRIVGADQIQYLDVRTHTMKDFFEIEKQRRVVMIRGVPESWRPFDWSFKSLCEQFPRHRFKVGKDDRGYALKLTMLEFMAYCHRQRDDSPLYIFDSNMGGGAVADILNAHYSPPAFFPDDLMSFAPDRPPYKWFLCGPKRSGTCCHIDPLYTSAWNTLLVGRKKWAIIPPDVPRNVAKGRTVMKKGEDDEAVHFFVDLVPRMREQGVPIVEIIQEPGETIYVPGGWWHCVLNITDTVAVTQNYCGRNNFNDVWRSAREERPCWSHKWLDGMRRRCPEWAEAAKKLNEADNFDMNALLALHDKRRQDRRERRLQRAKMKARVKARQSASQVFDDSAWERNYRANANYASDSTVSTTSDSSDSSDSSSSSDSDSDSSSSSAPLTSSSSAPSPRTPQRP